MSGRSFHPGLGVAVEGGTGGDAELSCRPHEYAGRLRRVITLEILPVPTSVNSPVRFVEPFRVHRFNRFIGIMLRGVLAIREH